MKHSNKKLSTTEITICILCFIFIAGIITWVVISNINERYKHAYTDNFILTGPGSIVNDLEKLHPKVKNIQWSQGFGFEYDNFLRFCA